MLKLREYVKLANDNADGQTIVSGDIESLNDFENNFKNNKKRFIPLM